MDLLFAEGKKGTWRRSSELVAKEMVVVKDVKKKGKPIQSNLICRSNSKNLSTQLDPHCYAKENTDLK